MNIILKKNRITVFFLIIFTIISCKPTFDAQKYKTGEFSFQTNEVEIDDNLFEIILNAKKNFEEKYNFSPDVIVLDIVKLKDEDHLLLSSSKYLYSSEKEKNRLQHKFIGAKKIDQTILLVQRNDKIDLTLLKEKSETIQISLNYGSLISACDQIYDIKKNEFILLSDYCSFDVYTE